MFRTPTRKRPARPQPRSAEIKTLPPSTGGINDRDALIGMPPLDALRVENWICRPYGIQVRNGYTEFASLATSADPSAVHTLMPFTPGADPEPEAFASSYDPFRSLFTRDPSQSIHRKQVRTVTPDAELFAGMGDAIYDITAGGLGPFTAETGPVGSYWTWTHFTTLGGTFMPICPIEGGYWYYDGTTWHEVVAGDGIVADTIAGVDPALFTFVIAFKGRLWFVEKDSTRGWYLPPGQLFGVAESYDFGTVFRKGGSLVAMASWTQDAGVGIDDQFVVCGSMGDISIYKGYDPVDISTWALVGTWYAGPFPLSNRVFDNYGGDLHILSTGGIMPLSRLLRLGDTEQDQVKATDKINNTLAQFVQIAEGNRGWGLKYLPMERIVAILLPFAPLQRATMVVQDVNTKGWSVLYDHPCSSMEVFNGVIYAGTHDGRIVLAFDGALDDRRIEEPNGLLIETRVVPRYSDFDKPGLEKIVTMLRMTMLGSLPPQITIGVLVNYALQQFVFTPALPRIDEARWDEALWDFSFWSGGYKPITSWAGVAGIGYAITAQIDMKAYGGLVLSQYDWLFTTGGPM